jgi:hypothetical protein
MQDSRTGILKSFDHKNISFNIMKHFHVLQDSKTGILKSFDHENMQDSRTRILKSFDHVNISFNIMKHIHVLQDSKVEQESWNWIPVLDLGSSNPNKLYFSNIYMAW